MRRVRGFTLVELLVVIGIIALLISMLLPALQSARRQALAAKCAAQMRDLGNAFILYSQDNKGYVPPVRLNQPYNINGVIYDKGSTERVNVAGKADQVNENAKWWHFIAKYLTKNRAMNQVASDAANITKETWWCPAFDGYTDTLGAAVNMVGGINRNLPGIGMNDYPSLTASYPAANLTVAGGFPPVAEKFFDCFNPNPAVTPPGHYWYKHVQFKNSAERALLGDSTQYYLEAQLLTANQAIPGQRLLFSSNDYSSATSGQTTFDFYRHGKYPVVNNGDPKTGMFQASGGKIAYNILFADGHVVGVTDRESGYKACRMRFPD